MAAAQQSMHCTAQGPGDMAIPGRCWQLRSESGQSSSWDGGGGSQEDGRASRVCVYLCNGLRTPISRGSQRNHQNEVCGAKCVL